MTTRSTRSGDLSRTGRRWLTDQAETKPFYLTSEFWAGLIASLGIAITAASSHAFGGWRAWVLIAAITSAYILSRGIAKSARRYYDDDPDRRVP